MTAKSGVSIRLVSLRLGALEVLEHARRPVVSVEINEGSDSVHPLQLSSIVM